MTFFSVKNLFKGSLSQPLKTERNKRIFDNAVVTPQREIHSRNVATFPDNAQINETFSKNNFESIYKIEKEKELRLLGIHSHDIQFVHKLPMLIHFVWISNDIRTGNNYDMETEENLKTFSIYAAIGWKIIVWDNKKVHNIFCADTNKNKDFCTVLTDSVMTKKYNITLSMKSDVLRFFIIYEFGGMYFDTDFIAVRSMNHIIEENIKKHGLIVANEYNVIGAQYLSGGFFAAYPGNMFIENAKNHVVRAIRGKNKSNFRTGPYFFKKALVSTFFETFEVDSVTISKFNLSKIATVLPTRYLYKFPWKIKENMAELERVKKFPQTYFVHLWRGSWLRNSTDHSEET